MNVKQTGKPSGYSLTDRSDRTQALRIDSTADPLKASIEHLVEKQNRLLSIVRRNADMERRELKEMNKSLRNQLRDLNGGAEEDYENVNDNLSTWSALDLVNLDKSCCNMNREGLQQLVRQLEDIKEVRTVNLSGNALNDDCASEFEQLVTCDRKGTDPEHAIGFSGINLSFNDLGAKAAEKLFKFGVVHKHLKYLYVEGNIDIAERPTMGALVAEWVKAAASKAGAGKKRASSSRRKGGAVAVNVPPPSQKKFESLRITLFDYKKEVDDQGTFSEQWPGAGGKKKGRSSRGGGARAGKGKKKGAGSAPGSNPMNALAFVRGIFGLAADRKGAGKKRPPARRAAAAKKGKRGGDDSNLSPELKREALFKDIGEDDIIGWKDLGHSDGDVFFINPSAEEFEEKLIHYQMFGKNLDVPITGYKKEEKKKDDKKKGVRGMSERGKGERKKKDEGKRPLSEVGDTLLCWAVRCGKAEHVRVLLGNNADPTQPNVAGSTPAQIAKYCQGDTKKRTRWHDIFEMVVEAALEYDPSKLDYTTTLPDDSVETKKVPPITSLGLVHAKLSKETITVLGANLFGLTSLDISGGFIGAYGAQCLATALLRKPQTLASLCVASNSIGCAGISLIASSLQFNDTLTDLDVSGNDIKDRGAKNLSRGIRQNSVLASLHIGDNPISAEAVHNLLRVARKCENLNSVKGTDQLLAPVKLRSMVEHNSEGREGAESGGVLAGGDSDDDSDEEDEKEACREQTMLFASSIAGQTGGGEWDCLKLSGVALGGEVKASAQVKLGKRQSKGAKKPVRGYTLALARRRFGLRWSVIETLERNGEDDSMKFLAYSEQTFKEFAGLAGDEVSLWLRVEPFGKGSMEGVVSRWKVEGSTKVSMKDGGGTGAVWN